MKGPFYIYIIFDQKRAIPIYAGSTNDPKSRLAWHKFNLKRLNITPIMALYKEVNTREMALKEEEIVVKYLLDKYPEYVLNNYMKSEKYATNTGQKRYTPRISWVYLSPEEKNELFELPQWGDYSKIGKACGYNAERVRQIFTRKPDKIHPDLFNAIKKYKNKKAQKLIWASVIELI